MASTCFRLVLGAYCHLKTIAPKGIGQLRRVTQYCRSTPKMIVLPAFIAYCDDSGGKNQSPDTETDGKLQMPDPSTLSTEYLIRNASLDSLDSALRLLSLTSVALTDLEKEYARWTFVLIKFMKYRLTVLGKPQEEERVLDLIVQARSKINELKNKRRDLNLLYQTVTNMVSSAAEAALIAGVDYQVSTANQAMISSQVFLREIQHASQEAEKELAAIQAETITIETKHAEEEENLRKEEESKRIQQELLEKEKLEKETEEESEKNVDNKKEEINNKNDSDSLFLEEVIIDKEGDEGEVFVEEIREDTDEEMIL